MWLGFCWFFFFFFNDTATTEIYTLSLHDALPIAPHIISSVISASGWRIWASMRRDRKSTRLNSSHTVISYAVSCLKKKKKQKAGCRTQPELDRATDSDAERAPR